MDEASETPQPQQDPAAADAPPPEPTAEQNGGQQPAVPRVVLLCPPYAVQIDAGGLPMEVVENKLEQALAYVRRELIVKRFQEMQRSVQVVNRLPRMNP